MNAENHKLVEVPDETPVVSLEPNKPAENPTGYIKGVRPQLETKQDKMDFARKAIEAKEKENIKYQNFARAYRVDPGTLNYWIKEYRQFYGLDPAKRAPRTKKVKRIMEPQLPALAPERKEVALTNSDRTKQLEEQVRLLQERLEHTADQLREARDTVVSLQNVVIILGHQHSKGQ